MASRISRDSPDSLRALGTQCRCLARGASNRAVSLSLSEMAIEYERAAAKAEAAERGTAQAGN